MTPRPPANTGPGPMPGTDPREAARIIMGECHGLPFLPELTGRGIGADLTGRSLAMLTDLPVDVSPRGWRLADAAGRPARRAIDMLDRDCDALEESDELSRDADGAAADGDRVLQVRVTGPWSLAATLELPGGRTVLTDRGARRDVAASLAEGVAARATGLAGRMGTGTRIVLDEPMLWRVAAGTAPAPSEFDPVPAVPTDQLALALGRFADGLRAAGVDQVFLRPPTTSGPGEPAMYPEFAEPPRGENALDGLCLDAGPLYSARDHRALDAAGTVLGDGRFLQLEGMPGTGVPPATRPEAEQAAADLLGLLDRLSAPRYTSLGRVVLTPDTDQVHGAAASAIRALAGARMIAETALRIAE